MSHQNKYLSFVVVLMIPYLDFKEAEAILNKTPHLKDEFVTKIRSIERVWESHLMPKKYLALADLYHFLKDASDPDERRDINDNDISLLKHVGHMMAERDEYPILELHKKYTNICLNDPLDDYVFGTVGRIVHRIKYEEKVRDQYLSAFMLVGSFRIDEIAEYLTLPRPILLKQHSQRTQLIAGTIEQYFKEANHQIDLNKKETIALG